MRSTTFVDDKLTLPPALPEHAKPAFNTILINGVGGEDEIQQTVVEEGLESGDRRLLVCKEGVERIRTSVGDGKELSTQQQFLVGKEWVIW